MADTPIDSGESHSWLVYSQVLDVEILD